MHLLGLEKVRNSTAESKAIKLTLGTRLQRRSNPALLLRGAAAWQTGHFNTAVVYLSIPYAARD